MLFISDKAAHQVQEILIQNKQSGQVKEGEEQAVRIRVLGGGCSGLTYKLEFDHNIEEADQVFFDKGVKMVTDLKSFLFIANTTLDYSDGLNGKGFHFINPNAERTCSCGESFSV
jgi:iron-sulfur cluster assembly protein